MESGGYYMSSTRNMHMTLCSPLEPPVLCSGKTADEVIPITVLSSARLIWTRHEFGLTPTSCVRVCEAAKTQYPP